MAHTPRIQSWISPKARKGDPSLIEGRGVRALERIAAGEVVAIKGGHIVGSSVVANLPQSTRNSAFPIADGQFLAALVEDEYEGVMMLVNHSCDPNLGIGGNVLLVSMRDIAAGEELTIDYATFIGDPDFEMNCRCGAPDCRGVVKGTDWNRPELQRRYRGWFSWWLSKQMSEV